LTRNLIVLNSALRRWHHFLEQSESNSDDGDYQRLVIEVLDTILVWKEEHNDWLLLSSDLSESHDDNDNNTVVALNNSIVALLCTILATCSQHLRKEHWDFMLCSLVSWLQVCSYVLVSLWNISTQLVLRLIASGNLKDLKKGFGLKTCVLFITYNTRQHF